MEWYRVFVENSDSASLMSALRFCFSVISSILIHNNNGLWLRPKKFVWRLFIEWVSAVSSVEKGNENVADGQQKGAIYGPPLSEASPLVPDPHDRRGIAATPRKNTVTVTGFEVVECGICGQPTPVPPVCDTCGIKVCGPCMVGTSCRKCAQRVRETPEKVVRNLPATNIRRSPNAVRRPRRRQVTGKATEVPNRARSPAPPPVAKPPPTPAQRIARDLEHGNKKMISITTTDPIERLRTKSATFRKSLSERHIKLAEREIPGCSDEVAEFQAFLTEIDSQLDEVPSIDVAFLGPSRHGKEYTAQRAGGQFYPADVGHQTLYGVDR